MLFTPMLVSISPASIPHEFQISTDVECWGFTLIVSLLAGIVFGNLSSTKLSNAAPDDSLLDGGRSATAGIATHRINNVIIVFEVALAALLLVGSSLLIRTFLSI